MQEKAQMRIPILDLSVQYQQIAGEIQAAVERVLNSRKPRARYSVGMLTQRVIVPLKRVLPHRLFEAILAIALGL